MLVEEESGNEQRRRRGLQEDGWVKRKEKCKAGGPGQGSANLPSPSRPEIPGLEGLGMAGE